MLLDRSKDREWLRGQVGSDAVKFVPSSVSLFVSVTPI